MKNIKKALVLTLSLLFVMSFSLCVFAENAGSNSDSLSDAGADFGSMITDIIGSFGGEADADYSSIFSGIGALGDIDFGGYLSNINIGSLGEDLQTFMGNFLNFDDISMGGIGDIVNDLGMGDFAAMLSEGLGGFIGVGSEGGNIGEGGFTDFISGVAGSIADMTGDFDISEFISGLVGGESGSNSNGTNEESPEDIQTPVTQNPPPVNLGGGGGSNTQTPPAITVPLEDEIITHEFTTQTGFIYKPVENDNEEINEPVKEKNTNKIAAGIILVLGSFGTVAYLVIKKVI